MSDDNRLNSLHHEINRRFDDLDNKLSKQDKDKEEIDKRLDKHLIDCAHASAQLTLMLKIMLPVVSGVLLLLVYLLRDSLRL